MKFALAVFRKEVIDALRDRKTLLVMLLSSVLIGPLVLVLISGLVSQIESRAEKRVVLVAGMEYAPQLRNYIERQTYTLKDAPADYETQLKASKLGDPVIVVAKDFQEKLARGEAPVVEVVSDSSNRNASIGVSAATRLLSGFNREQGMLTLAVRGVSPGVLQTVAVEERDLASTASRAAQLTGMLPFFVIMAVLYGALNAALDTTAGERERGSLEPLLMNPASRLSIVLGKWGAVALLGMLIAVLSVLSFFPAKAMLQSETLQAMFQFGAREGGAFIALLVPFAAALSAVLMAVAIRCKTFKEAQASNTFVIFAVSMLPLVTVFSQSGEQPWYLWVPGLAQQTVMARVLKGEELSVLHVLAPALVCAVLAAACIAYITQHLKHAALKS
jgi:sodium transport system permease protein